MSFVNPLDFYDILVNKLAGSEEIFLFLSFLVIAALAGRFRMPGGVFIIVFLMFITLLMGTVLGGLLQGIFLLILVGVAYTISIRLSRGFGG